MGKNEEFENPENIAPPINYDSMTGLGKDIAPDSGIDDAGNGSSEGVDQKSADHDAKNKKRSAAKKSKEKKKTKRKKLHLKATLFVAAVLLVVMVTTLVLWSRWLWNLMVAEVDEALYFRSEKIITYNNWVNIMQRAEQQKSLIMDYAGDPDAEVVATSDDPSSGYIISISESDYENATSVSKDEEGTVEVRQSTTSVYYTVPEYSFYAEEQDHEGIAVYSAQELYKDSPDGVSLVASAVITDPDGDMFYVIDDKPHIEYGGLIYRENLVFDSEMQDYSTKFEGMNRESRWNTELLDEAMKISMRYEEERRDWEAWPEYQNEFGWYNDYRYIAFEDTVYYDVYQSFQAPEDEYSTIVEGSLSTSAGGNSFILNDGHIDIYAEESGGVRMSGTLMHGAETVIFVDMHKNRETWKDLVKNRSVIFGIIYILVVVGCGIFEQMRTPEAETDPSEEKILPKDQIPTDVASLLIHRINDIEQSTGPNGYLDQLRDEIDSRKAPESEGQGNDGK